MTNHLDLDTRPEHIRYLQAAARVLLRTDRILAGRPDLGFSLPESGPAPAWSDGVTVAIRSNDWKRSFEDDGATARLLGLNYHELCHIMFTPRQGSRAFSAMQAADSVSVYDLKAVYNLAEDQRIETLFSTLYRPGRAFFIQAVADLILVDGTDASKTWLLVAGRRYLPQSLRAASRAAFAGDADAYEALVNEYLLIDWDFSDDIVRGVELLEAMATMIDAVVQTVPESCGSPAPTKGTPEAEAEGQAAEQVAQDIEAEKAESDEAEGEGGEAKEEARGEQDESQGPETPEGAEEAEGTPTEDGEEQNIDSAISEDEGTESEATQAEGASDEPTQAELDEAVSQEAQAARREVESQIVDDTTNTDLQIDAEIEAASGEMGESLPHHEDRVPVTDAARSLAYELEGVLADLRLMVDPGWLTHRDRGRINTGRYLRREAWEPMDEVFDEWSEGAEDALDIEIAILVDTSSSMGHPEAGQVAEASWALKSALDHYEIPVAVIGFDSGTHLIYGAMDEADTEWMPKPLSRGSTNLGPALLEVGRHFNYSSHKRRILVVLTDGHFSDTVRLGGWGAAQAPTEDVVQTIDAEVRVLLRFGEGATREDWGFDEVQDISEIDQMVDAVRETIVEGVKNSGVEAAAWH